MIAQAIRFGLVGSLATVIHLVVGWTLLLADVGPTISNLTAFAVAFGFSFLGHSKYTFANVKSSRHRAFFRFVGVASFGFLVNHLLFLGLLHQTEFASGACLFVSTCFAAVATFVLLQKWAFRA